MGVASGCGEQEVGVATGCGCEVYRFPHTTLIPTRLVSVLFSQQHPYFLFIFILKKMYIYV